MKKGILVVSFGTTYIETRQNTIEAIEREVQEHFPEYEVRRAFTSHIVRKKIEKQEGIHIPDVDEALDQMKADGFQEVYLSSLHVIPGHEYSKLIHAAYRHRSDFEVIKHTKPLLYDKDHYIQAKEALQDIVRLEEKEVLFLMGHGSDHASNATYVMLRHFLERDQQTQKIYVGTVEGYPELEDIIEEIKEKDYETVALLPFMIVAGDHANNDMASDEEDSWKSILEKNGYKTKVILKGLGEYEEFRKIFVQRLEEIM